MDFNELGKEKKILGEPREKWLYVTRHISNPIVFHSITPDTNFFAFVRACISYVRPCMHRQLH